LGVAVKPCNSELTAMPLPRLNAAGVAVTSNVQPLRLHFFIQTRPTAVALILRF